MGELRLLREVFVEGEEGKGDVRGERDDDEGEGLYLGRKAQLYRILL